MNQQLKELEIKNEDFAKMNNLKECVVFQRNLLADTMRKYVKSQQKYWCQIPYFQLKALYYPVHIKKKYNLQGYYSVWSGAFFIDCATGEIVTQNLGEDGKDVYNPYEGNRFLNDLIVGDVDAKKILDKLRAEWKETPELLEFRKAFKNKYNVKRFLKR